MNRLRVILVAFCFLAVCGFLTGCDPEEDAFDAAKQFEKEVAEIDSYLELANIPHIKDKSGIRIVPTIIGSQLPAQYNSTINVDYKGTLFTTDELFDEGNAKGPLNNFIGGWQVAMMKLPVGSQVKLYIPSYYAYGPSGSGKIPANATLVFDVKVNSAVQGTVYKSQFTYDTTAINNYVTSKGLTVTKDPTGIRYINQLEGTGATPTWFSTVKLKSTFTLLTDDTKVVATYDKEPVENFSSFVVDYVHGMQVALMKMKEGGKMRVIIPSGLGFGIDNATDNGKVVIPANSNLIVDIELIEVN
jgi:FKBP-type peptidyl-prolyl cis-trans isomerase FkpA